MINYSSINDAWGNKEKEIYKNNESQNIETLNNQPQRCENKQIEHFEVTTQPKSCALMNHIKECSECRMKMAEMFTNTDNSNTCKKTINILGLKINITNDVLKVLFLIIIIAIFILLLSIINLSFTKTNTKYVVLPSSRMNGY